MTYSQLSLKVAGATALLLEIVIVKAKLSVGASATWHVAIIMKRIDSHQHFGASMQKERWNSCVTLCHAVAAVICLSSGKLMLANEISEAVLVYLGY